MPIVSLSTCKPYTIDISELKFGKKKINDKNFKIMGLPYVGLLTFWDIKIYR